ncbi:hypothetical protein FGO68_gene11894 [Halteria grandinella]|uniref:Uncharacterized protein n=1 Tax=Halteria grandinella TaxID=5974 RepID=A0A8J8SY63_HALGN|nr:hypothetical protein FGO68_gene11894 [Halteria grandinella]
MQSLKKKKVSHKRKLLEQQELFSQLFQQNQFLLQFQLITLIMNIDRAFSYFLTKCLKIEVRSHMLFYNHYQHLHII